MNKGEQKQRAERILVIDDEQLIRDIFRRLFEQEGFEMFEASDGESGMALFRQCLPDLVVTDIVIPIKNGFEVIEELKRDFPEVKIIAISGSHINESGLFKNGKRLDVEAAFQKPIEFLELLEVVRGLLNT